jgi:hypothetical protein
MTKTTSNVTSPHRRALAGGTAMMLALFAGACTNEGGGGNAGSAGAGTTGAPVDRVSYSGSSPSASVDTTYQLDTGGVVSCLYAGNQLSIEAGPAGSSKGFYVDVNFTDVTARGPFTRTDAWQPLSPPLLADFWFDEAHQYWLFYDCQDSQPSTCTTTVTEFSDQRLQGTVDCTGLVPEDGSPDAPSGCATPEPHATASITFDCAINP